MLLGQQLLRALDLQDVGDGLLEAVAEMCGELLPELRQFRNAAASSRVKEVEKNN